MATNKIKQANRKWKHEHKRKQLRARKKTAALDLRLSDRRKMKAWQEQGRAINIKDMPLTED